MSLQKLEKKKKLHRIKESDISGSAVFLNCPYRVQQSYRRAVVNQGAAFPNLAPTLPTMQFSHTGTSLEAIYQITCIFLWSHKRRYISIFKYVAVLPKTRKHTLMCKIGGVKLLFKNPKGCRNILKSDFLWNIDRTASFFLL